MQMPYRNSLMVQLQDQPAMSGRLTAPRTEGRDEPRFQWSRNSQQGLRLLGPGPLHSRNGENCGLHVRIGGLPLSCEATAIHRNLVFALPLSLALALQATFNALVDGILR